MSVLSAVLGAFGDDVRSVDDIAERTGLRRDLVLAAVDHLLIAGKLVAEPLRFGCSPAACAGCALVSRGCGGAPQSRSRTLRVAGQ